MTRKILLTLLLASAALPALATNDNYQPIDNKVYAFQDDKPWQEGAYTLPAYPADADWVRFFVPLQTDYTYYVDSKSLTLGDDGVIRYVLRMLSKSGANNISFEGLRCSGRSTRAYAFANASNQSWIASTRAMWKSVLVDNPVRKRLMEDFCPEGNQPANAAQALANLKKAPMHF